MIPHVPREETFQAAWAYSAGGRVQKHTANSESTSVHFPALFAHTLLCTESTWIHLAQLRHHKAQFTFLAPQSYCFRETKSTLNRHRERKSHELQWEARRINVLSNYIDLETSDNLFFVVFYIYLIQTYYETTQRKENAHKFSFQSPPTD